MRQLQGDRLTIEAIMDIACFRGATQAPPTATRQRSERIAQRADQLAAAPRFVSISNTVEFGQKSFLPVTSPRSQRSQTSSLAQLRQRFRTALMMVCVSALDASAGSRPTASSILVMRRSEFVARYLRYAKTKATAKPAIAMAANNCIRDMFIVRLLAS
jgi:hypothetical protein